MPIDLVIDEDGNRSDSEDFIRLSGNDVEQVRPLVLPENHNKDGCRACSPAQTQFVSLLLKRRLNLNRFHGAEITPMPSPSDLRARRGHLVVETLLRVGKTAASKVKPTTHGTQSSQAKQTGNGDPRQLWNYVKCFGLHAGIRLGGHNVFC